jgi:hypothetical protein
VRARGEMRDERWREGGRGGGGAGRGGVLACGQAGWYLYIAGLQCHLDSRADSWCR